VLVAEQLFASGCRLLLSITSSGQVATLGPPPYFILIKRALRDEGTSYHYLPAGPEYVEADPALLSVAEDALATINEPVERGATWTTDAPYRETVDAIAAARADGILAVEMEAAALYAFAEASRCSASRMLPIRWVNPGTSRKGRPMVRQRRWPSFEPSPRLTWTR
jgi:purine-nucleoside phosphorylase